MNRQMWENPATGRNIASLRADGVDILGPACGDQACGETGLGRMLEAEDILAEMIAHFQPKWLAGKRVLLTAGPTFEAIDPVRGITNLSTGKMGYAIARAAREAGAQVTLVSGPVSLPCPQGVTRIAVTSACRCTPRCTNRSPAATSSSPSPRSPTTDRRTDRAQDQERRPGDATAIELVQNPDILAEVAALRDPPLCVGFAAESENLAEYAENKRRSKKIPLLVGNLIHDGFGGDDNTLILFDDEGQHPLPSAPKLELARQLVARIASLLEKRR
jgi:phosphopantothenoylcysteine decarboxylase/phosphopantothenate--cysteine ligase